MRHRRSPASARRFRQPEVADVPAAVAAAIRDEPDRRAGPPRGLGRADRRQPGDRGHRPDRPRGGRDASRAGLRPLRRRGDGQPRRRHRRGPAGAPGRVRRHRGGARLPDPLRDGDRRPRHQLLRPADPLRPERLRGRRDRPAEPDQAAHLVHRPVRERPAQDADDRPGQASGGGAGPQARPAGPEDDAPRGRRVPARADAGGARPRPARERPRAHRAGRRGRARGAARRRAPPARRGTRPDGHGCRSTRSTC